MNNTKNNVLKELCVKEERLTKQWMNKYNKEQIEMNSRKLLDTVIKEKEHKKKVRELQKSPTRQLLYNEGGRRAYLKQQTKDKSVTQRFETPKTTTQEASWVVDAHFNETHQHNTNEFLQIQQLQKLTYFGHQNIVGTFFR